MSMRTTLIAALTAWANRYEGDVAPDVPESMVDAHRAEVLTEYAGRLASRATLYGDSATVNEVMRDLTRLAAERSGKDAGDAQPAGESTQPGPFERVTVYLTPASSAALTHAAEITGDSKTDTINRSIQSYALLTSEVADGGRVIVRHPDESQGGAR